VFLEGLRLFLGPRRIQGWLVADEFRELKRESLTEIVCKLVRRTDGGHHEPDAVEIFNLAPSTWRLSDAVN